MTYTTSFYGIYRLYVCIFGLLAECNIPHIHDTVVSTLTMTSSYGMTSDRPSVCPYNFPKCDPISVKLGRQKEDGIRFIDEQN